MKKFLSFLSMAAILVAAASCSEKDTVIAYGDAEFGMLDNGKILTDSGVNFVVVDNQSSMRTDTTCRVYIVCDVLTVNSSGGYDIRLTNALPVLTKEILSSSAVTVETMKDDPINVWSAWYGGGYLNLGITFLAHNPGKDKHVVDVVRDESEGSSVIKLRVLHDAGKDAVDDYASENYVSASTYVSFHLAPLITSDSTTAVKVEWNWFQDPESLDGVRQVYSMEGSIL